jgi:hypothetical protein
MRIKALFITAIMGVAVVAGICKGLVSPRGAAKKEGGEKEGAKEESAGSKSDL